MPQHGSSRRREQRADNAVFLGFLELARLCMRGKPIDLCHRDIDRVIDLGRINARLKIDALAPVTTSELLARVFNVYARAVEEAPEELHDRRMLRERLPFRESLSHRAPPKHLLRVE
jgi:hypothetical protein